MSQNLVFPNKDNLVKMTFNVDLSLATNIVIQFGAETYQLSDATVTVTDTYGLNLDLSATSEVGQHYVTVTYFDGGSTNGTDITSRELNNLSQIIVAIGTQLIIEDGSQVDNANSFASDEEYKAYASLRGLAIAVTQPERESNLIAGMDYLKASECNMQGVRASSTQALLYPRKGVMMYGYDLATNAIPDELKFAQMEAAAYSTSNTLLHNTASTSNIKSKQIDTMKTEYFEGTTSTKITLQRVNAHLSVLLSSSSGLVRT